MVLCEIHTHIKGGQLVASGISIYYFERCVIHASPPFPFFLISTIHRNRNKNMKCWLSGKAIDFYKYIYIMIIPVSKHKYFVAFNVQSCVRGFTLSWKLSQTWDLSTEIDMISFEKLIILWITNLKSWIFNLSNGLLRLFFYG